MKVLVGSNNPVKLEAAKEAFAAYYEDVEAVGINVDSNVPDQPIGDETYAGAENRALQLLEINDKEKLNADYFVGIEGGVSKVNNKLFAFGCMCILNKKKQKSFGTSPHFELPNLFSQKIMSGTELGILIDKHTDSHNTKQKAGAIGYFTKGKMDRKDLYVHGLIVALIPFINEKLYFD
ncbi:MAG: inosine/xanthosine triphosphatase [Ignavibacteriae bacterium]|nr:inosine/xanthosine triphosphatase [Ignavibacteriota bacterium]NOG99039.1 inosine/xanthosine triphosphatase [Ignavibacteriota bacterium]